MMIIPNNYHKKSKMYLIIFLFQNKNTKRIFNRISMIRYIKNLNVRHLLGNYFLNIWIKKLMKNRFRNIIYKNFKIFMRFF